MRLHAQSRYLQIPVSTASFGSNNYYYCLYLRGVEMSSQSPTFTNKAHFSALSKPEKMHFTLTCTGVPPGSSIAFTCDAALPDGTIIKLPKTNVETSSKVGYFIEADIPADWESEITYSYWAGGNPKSNFEISMSAYISPYKVGSAFVIEHDENQLIKTI